MGREVRMVPPDWQHPKNEKGNWIPLLEGDGLAEMLKWAASWRLWEKNQHPDQLENGASGCRTLTDWEGEPPNPDDYMGEFLEGTDTHFMMYESTSEGTPISPAFATAEELARWLADKQASAFAGDPASYDQWLATIKQGSAPSMVLTVGEGIVSGVEDAGRRQR